MEVIGRGFLAGCLKRTLAPRHPHAIAIAAGVSSTSVTSRSEFDRESDLVREILSRCRREGRLVVFFSTASAAMYGSGGPYSEDEPVAPRSEYGRHKRALERTVQDSGASYLVLRLSHLVGPSQRSHQLFPGLTRQILSGTVKVHRHAQRDLLDVADLVQALDGMLSDSLTGEVVNIASGTPEPIDRIVATLEQRLERTAERIVVDGEPTRTVVCVDKMHRLVPEAAGFGFGPDYLPRLVRRYVEP
jgi:nucleoside-diphosphate-sugar epimerase